MSCYLLGNQRYENSMVVETVFNFRKGKLKEEYEKYKAHPTENIFTSRSEAIARYNDLQHRFNPHYYDNNGARIDGIDPNSEVDPIVLEHETGVKLITYKNTAKNRIEYKVDVMEPNLEYVMIDGKIALNQRKEAVWEFKSGYHNDPDWQVLNGKVDRLIDFNKDIKEEQKSIQAKSLEEAFKLRREELRKAYNEIKHQERKPGFGRSPELHQRKKFIEEELERIKNFLHDIREKHDLGHLIEWANQELGILGERSEKNSVVQKLADQLHGDELYQGQHSTFIKQLEFISNQWKAILKTVRHSQDSTIDPDVMKKVLKIVEAKGSNKNLNRAVDEIGDIKSIAELKSRIYFSETKSPTIEEAMAGASNKDYHRLNYELLADIQRVATERISQIEGLIERKENEVVLKALFTNEEFKQGIVKFSGELNERFPSDGFYSTEEAEEIINELSSRPDQIYNQNDEFTKFVRLIGAVREEKIKIDSQLRNQFLDITRSEVILGPVAQYLYDEGTIRYSANTKRTSEEIRVAEEKILPVLERIREEEGDTEEEGVKRYGKKSLYDVFLDDEVVTDINGERLKLYKHGLVKPYIDAYYSMRDKQEAIYNRSLRRAEEGEKINRKAAYRKFYEEILKNSNILDFRRLPGIHSKAFAEVFQALDPDDSTGFEYAPDDQYYNNMLKYFGGRTEFMDTYIQHINEMLGEYARLKVHLDAEVDFFENGDSTRGIDPGIIGMSRANADIELMMNNPIYVLREIYDGVDSRAFNKALEGNTHSHHKYLMTVPRLKEAKVKSTETSNFEVIETAKDTEFYNKKFARIIRDDDLFEYYLFSIGKLRHLKDFMPVARIDEFTDFELPIVNPITEDQQSKQLIKQFNTTIDTYIKNAHESVITRNIRKFEREIVRDPFAQAIEQEMKGPETSIIFKANTYGYYTESGLDYRLRNYFSFLVANKKVDPKTDAGKEFARVEMLKYVNLNKSYDVNHVLKNYSRSAYNYYHRNQVLPILSYMRKFYQYKVENNKMKEEGPDIWKAKLRKRQDEYNRMMDWILRIVMNAREPIGKDREIEEYKEESSLYTELMRFYGGEQESKKVYKGLHKLFYKFGLWMKYTKADREIIKDVFSKLNAENVPNEEAIKYADNLLMGLYNKLNGNGYMDNYFAFVNWLFLGFRPVTALFNLGEGLDSNYTEAIRGEKFNIKDFWRSLGILTHSTAAFHTSLLRRTKRFEDFGRTKTANKLRYIMEAYNVLQDATEDANSYVLQDKSLQKLRTVDPFVFTSAAEYINQGQLALMHFMNRKVVGKDGTESNMWDMLDWDEKNEKVVIKDNFDTKYNRGLIFPDDDGNVSKGMIQMNHLIQETAVTIHGNYANTRNMMVKSGWAGAFMVMRSYLPEKLNYSYGGYRYDLSNQTVRAGILKSVSYGSAFVMSNLIWLNNKAFIGRKVRNLDKVGGIVMGVAFVNTRRKSMPLYMDKVDGDNFNRARIRINNELRGAKVILGAMRALAEDHIYMKSRRNANVWKVDNEQEKADLKVFTWMFSKATIILLLKMFVMSQLFKLIYKLLFPNESQVTESSIDRYRNYVNNHMMRTGEEINPFRVSMGGGAAVDPAGTVIAPVENMLRQIDQYESELNALEEAIGELEPWMYVAIGAKAAAETVIPKEFGERLEDLSELLIDDLEFKEKYRFKDHREEDTWFDFARYYDDY